MKPLVHPIKNLRNYQTHFSQQRISVVPQRSLSKYKLDNPFFTPQQIQQYKKDGFIILPNFIQNNTLIEALKTKMEGLFQGKFETGHYPDEWHWREGMSLPNITREICNAWKCDKTISSVVCSAVIGKMAAELMGWEGTRLGQDDLWMKPPNHGKEIAYHTDCAYIPWEEITCWIALDDVSSLSGTLEYVKGSHLWQKYKDNLDTSGFHAPNKDYQSTLYHAASAEGISEEQIKKLITKVEVPAGGCSFHNGLIWHGSGKNTSTNWRRSIGIHLIPSDSSFKGKDVGYIYGRYKLHNSDVMEETFFPILYMKSGHRSLLLKEYTQDALLDL